MEKSSTQEVQSILSIGYVYLIILGICSETLYYNQLDINILKYSSILDVLISPISKLTSNNLGLYIFLVVLFIAFSLPGLLVKNKGKNTVIKSLNIDPNLNEEQIKSSLSRSIFTLLAIGLFAFFIGSGAGSGEKVLNELQKGKIEYKDYIEFIDSEKLEVKIVGVNSSYIFYLQKGNKKVKISPINGVIKSIQNKK